MKEARIEDDLTAWGVLMEVSKLLEERGLMFEERWAEGDLFISIVEAG